MRPVGVSIRSVGMTRRLQAPLLIGNIAISDDEETMTKWKDEGADGWKGIAADLVGLQAL